MTKPSARPDDDRATLGEDLRLLLDRAADRAFEVSYIKASSAHRLAERARTLAARFGATREGRVVVRALGRPGAGQSGEVWLLRASAMAGEPGTPWQYLRAEGFEPRESVEASHGICLVARGAGEADFVAGTDPELVFMSHPWSGLVEVEFGAYHELVDLAGAGGHVTVRPARRPAVERPAGPGAAPSPETDYAAPPTASPAPALTPADEAFLARCRDESPRAVAVHCPRWLGISSATTNLFALRYCVPETREIDPATLDDASIERHARVLADSGVPVVVVSGGDLVQLRLAQRLKSLRPSVAIDVLYHGGYTALASDYEWRVVRAWIGAAREGLVRGVCTVKAGMERFFRAQGVASALVLNAVPGEVMRPPALEAEPLRLGLWLSGVSALKTPLAMISSIPLLGRRASLHAAGLGARALELTDLLGIERGEWHDRPIPHEVLMQAIRRTHATLYVTFSECCPMLPLESLRHGVPCLFGPVSHLFEDDSYLFERLVVPFPDRADVIARSARRAAEERADIIAAYARYAPAYNARAAASVEALIRQGPTLS